MKIITFLLLFAGLSMSAQVAGEIDPTFTIGNSISTYASIRAIAVQSDGKIIGVGEFSKFNDDDANGIIRFNPDGTKDESFVTGIGFNGIVHCVAIQPDGKILLGGAFTSYNGELATYFIRLNTDGSYDHSLDSSTNGIVRCIVVQPDGKILVGGQFGSFNGFACSKIVRINPDGTLDSSFLTTTGYGFVASIALQSTGKIMIGGSFSTYNGSTVNNIARLT